MSFREILANAKRKFEYELQKEQSLLEDDSLPMTEEEWDASDAMELLAGMNGPRDYLISMDTDDQGRPAGITITNGLGEVLMDKELNPEDYPLED